MRTRKKIWIINQYISTPKHGGDGHRHYFLAKELIKKGYHISLITGSNSHLQRKTIKSKKQFNFINEESGIDTLVIKTNKYSGSESSGRIFSMLLFFFKLFLIPRKLLPKPNFIIVSSISLLPIIYGYFLKTFIYKNAKLIFEIRDIWPLSIIELGAYSPHNPFIKFLSFIERFGYKNADYMTSVLPLAYKHFEKIAGKKLKFKHIPNGIHIAKESIEGLPKEICDMIPKDKFIVAYTGSLGIANAMEYFVDAANILKDNSNITFCIVGDGPEKEFLKQRALHNNIIFIPKIQKSMMHKILEHFNVVYIGSRDIPLYQFGVSANKTFDYMYAAKPILMSGLIPDNEIELAQCGKMIEPDNSQLIANAIIDFYNMTSVERNLIGENGKRFVMQYRNFGYLASKYEEVFAEIS